ncbi:MAG: S1-like domain-containing RNA-binding protein [Sulfurospirillaceae bacterium]|nr:S1-like domain-containing RNA-binding protein [Sulfurospirillaceae bacterium]MDD3462424.1 S1-like domain-containing RNA-binding protein [Sulfurospirillaceae bacterium]
MNDRIKIGVMNTLRVERRTGNGMYLVASDGQEVLLPNQYITDAMVEGTVVEVFIYTDSEDRLVAVTHKPEAMLGEFGYFEVADIASFGAFVKWGLPKDLFIPKSLQKTPFEVGKKYVLRVGYDERTHRLIGSQKFSTFFRSDLEHLKVNQEVDILVRERTDLGYKVVVDNAYDGLIYHNEIFEEINVGDVKKAYIKKARLDKKLDISLQPIGDKNEDAGAMKIKEVLEQHNGVLKCTYKTEPLEIKKLFGLSRKNYKKALTRLIKAKIISLDDEKISLIVK